MTEKAKLLQYMRNSEHYYRNWDNSYYAVGSTFSLEEISHMSDREVENLLKLAEQIILHI